jgi:hypothetical protein
MTDIVIGNWYKHAGSPAYAKAIKFSGKGVEMYFDNGFKGRFPLKDFSEHFTTNAKSDKMNEGKGK